MFKTYKAGSDLSFSVSMNGGLRRVVFAGQTMGTSVYSTRDEKEQKAIESHYWFNDKFWISEEVDEKKVAAEAKRKAAAESKKKAAEKKTHQVTDFEDARDFLADEYGVSRSNMKTKDDILAIAQEKGVVLEGLD